MIHWGAAAGFAAGAGRLPQQRLYFLPLRQRQGSFRPVFATKFMIAAKARDVSKMLLEELARRWEELLSHRGSCRECGSERVWHAGTRSRKASVLIEGEVCFVGDVPQRRLKCGDCKARWTHAPDGISSRAHYQPCVVAHAVEALGQQVTSTATDIAHAHTCHRSTLRRWVERVADLAQPGELAAAVVAEAEAPVLPPVTAPARRASSPRLGRAIAILALLEALASLRGLEPPGLAHSAELARVVPAIAPTPRSRGVPRSAV